MSNETSYLMFIYVFGTMEKVVVTFENDYLDSNDLKYYKEKDVKEKISKALPSTWVTAGFDVLQVEKLNYVFTKVVKG